MSKLIDEFKAEHAAIVDTLSKVNGLGVGSVEGRAMLLSAKEDLLASHANSEELHFEIEFRHIFKIRTWATACK